MLYEIISPDAFLRPFMDGRLWKSLMLAYLGDYERQERRLRRVAAPANDDRSTPVRLVGRVGTEGPPPGLA
ncbi:MAG: hypothetical protein ACKN9W_05335 [Methylococcus sp.]